MDSSNKYIGLDIGGHRIGVAIGDGGLRMAWPHGVLTVDGTEVAELAKLIKDQSVQAVVVGRPRNQRGEATNQTTEVENYVERVVKPLGLPLHWQDESVTSVMAEERLKTAGKPYAKGDVDAEAAAIILQDFLEAL